MNVVMVQGLKGGVGTTTVAANLAAAFNNQHLPVLAIDLCCQNSLRLHFGMSLEDESGFAVSILQDQPWYQAAYQSYSGIQFMPFGQDYDNHCIEAVNDYVKKQPNWLQDWLAQLDLAEDCWVIIDCPVFPSPFIDACLALADISLLVFNPDAFGYTNLHTSNYARHLRVEADNNFFLLNRFCPPIALEKDVASLIKVDFSDCLSPITIHQDECLREAVAFKQTVFDCAPSSQSAQDFALTALWLTAKLNHWQDAS